MPGHVNSDTASLRYNCAAPSPQPLRRVQSATLTLRLRWLSGGTSLISPLAISARRRIWAAGGTHAGGLLVTRNQRNPNSWQFNNLRRCSIACSRTVMMATAHNRYLAIGFTICGDVESVVLVLDHLLENQTKSRTLLSSMSCFGSRAQSKLYVIRLICRVPCFSIPPALFPPPGILVNRRAAQGVTGIVAHSIGIHSHTMALKRITRELADLSESIRDNGYVFSAHH